MSTSILLRTSNLSSEHFCVLRCCTYNDSAAFATSDAERTPRRRRWNREIQRLARLFAGRYEEDIHLRLFELGVDDFIRIGDQLDWSQPNPSPSMNVNLTMA